MKKFLITLSLCLSLFSGTANAGIVLMASGATVAVSGLAASGDLTALMVGGLIVVPGLGLLTISRAFYNSDARITLLVLDEDGVRKINTNNLDEATIPVLRNAIEENYSEQEMRELVEELSN
ncbi:MAG: hypothetical protein HOE90_16040 [Bacteriovoracaceae bacterium]|jgi:hypothetical protein|nr:hypothetical protein [Bacteriovoracaceae bacterium]